MIINMLKLLKKDFTLALHPTNIIFLLFSAMLLVPSYPYYVVFFYATLGIFFMCLAGRENRDIMFSATLPVPKKDIVSARIACAVIIELAQLLIAIPFAVVRNIVIPEPNMAGMEANTVLFGLSLIMLGIFNLIFFTGYYKNPDKIGVPFVLAGIASFVFMGIAEGLTYISPFFIDKLDTHDPQFIGEKLIVLAAGIILFGMLTLAAVRISRRRFERLDL